MRTSLHRRRWAIIAIVISTSIATTGLLWLLRSGGRYIPPARTRTTIEFTACVLTDPHGIISTAAAPAWQGVQAAQAATNLKAQTLQTARADHLTDAVIAVNTLAQRSCNLIIATGPRQTAAVWKQASLLPTQRFLVIGPDPQGTATNVAFITDQNAATIKTKVASVTEAAVKGQFTAGPVKT